MILECALRRRAGCYNCRMNARIEQIAREVLELAPDQRAELADLLAENLESRQPDEIQRLWLDEADRRLAEVRSGSVETISGEEVLAEARRLIKR